MSFFARIAGFGVLFSVPLMAQMARTKPVTQAEVDRIAREGRVVTEAQEIAIGMATRVTRRS